MPTATDCSRQYAANLNKGMDQNQATTIYRNCMQQASGQVDRATDPGDPVTTGLPGITDEYLGLGGPDVNKLAQDVGYSALIVLMVMMAPKVIELGINTAAALYKQGAPGDSILG